MHRAKIKSSISFSLKLPESLYNNNILQKAKNQNLNLSKTIVLQNII